MSGNESATLRLNFEGELAHTQRTEKTKDVADRKDVEVKRQEIWWLNHFKEWIYGRTPEKRKKKEEDSVLKQTGEYTIASSNS